MDDSNEEKMVRTSVTVPESVMEKFKVYCKEKRRSVSAQVTLLMEKELKEEENNKQNNQS